MKLPDRNALTNPQHLFLYEHDIREIHNPIQSDSYALMYRQRYEVVLETITRIARGRRVLDVGCAQGNFSLALAEGGYRVTALDLQPAFLQYLRMKQETGVIACVNASLELLPFRPASFDVVLLGEVIEHVAHPDRLLASARELLSERGILVLTTPNGDRLHTGLPSLNQIRDRAALERRQFMPDADGHLFLLTRRELLAEIVTAGLDIVSHRFFSSPWISGRLLFRQVVSRLPVRIRRILDRWSTRVGLLDRYLSEGQIVVAQRKNASR